MLFVSVVNGTDLTSSFSVMALHVYTKVIDILLFLYSAILPTFLEG